MNKYEKRFKEALKEASETNTWEEAKLEWSLYNKEYIHDKTGTCICGKTNINWQGSITNKLNDSKLNIGGTCANKHLDLGYTFDRFLKALRPINEKHERNLKFFNTKEVIDAWELKFSLDTYRQVSLSDRQLIFKERIDVKIQEFLKQ